MGFWHFRDGLLRVLPMRLMGRHDDGRHVTLQAFVSCCLTWAGSWSKGSIGSAASSKSRLVLLVERWLVRVRMRNAPTISSSPAHIRDT